MAFAACWLILQRHQFGSRIWRYDLLGRPLAWHNTTASALVTPIAIGASAIAFVAVGNWLLLRVTHSTAPLVQRVLSVVEVVLGTLAVETALVPAIGTRPLVLTSCLGLPIALVAIAHADLARDKHRRDEVGEALRFETLHPAAKSNHRWHGDIIHVNQDEDAPFMRRHAGFRHRRSAQTRGALPYRSRTRRS
jgi:hypothetical protein